jgi:hypothetical protein
MNFVDIPIELKKLLLPDKNLSILEFLHITIPPIPLSTKFGKIDDYLAEDDPDPIDIQQIQRAGLPPATVLKSLHMIPAKKFSTIKSIKVPHLPASPHFPMWILSYWINLSEVRQLQLRWRNAEAALQKNCEARKGRPSPLAPLVTNVYTVLAGLPWNGQLSGCELPNTTLSAYMTTEWLSDEHETQMLKLLRQDLLRTALNSEIEVEEIHFISLLCNAYSNRSRYPTDRQWTWLQEKGHAFAMGVRRQAVALSHVGGNHWVAIVLDFEKATIRYGDSLGGQIDEQLKDALGWWTHYHTGRIFAHFNLPITQQHDSYSCGLLAWNALAAYLLEGTKLLRPTDVVEERLKVLLRVVDRHYACREDHIPSQVIPIEEAASEDNDDIEMMSNHTYDIDSTSSSTSDIDETNSIHIYDGLDSERLDVKPACGRNHASSAIRNALDLANDPKSMAPKGILRYFCKATEEEKRAQQLRETELQETKYQENKYFTKMLTIEQHQRRQELNRRRQQKFRMRKKSREIITGVRSPDGQKKRVSPSYIKI